MSADLDRLRYRLDGAIARLPDVPDRGSPAFVGRVTTATASIAPGKFLMVNPVTVTGAEAEGGAASKGVDTSASIPVYLLHGQVGQGDDLVVRHANWRWETSKGGPAYGCPTTDATKVCCVSGTCGPLPKSLTATSSYGALSLAACTGFTPSYATSWMGSTSITRSGYSKDSYGVCTAGTVTVPVGFALICPNTMLTDGTCPAASTMVPAGSWGLLQSWWACQLTNTGVLGPAPGSGTMLCHTVCPALYDPAGLGVLQVELALCPVPTPCTPLSLSFAFDGNAAIPGTVTVSE